MFKIFVLVLVLCTITDAQRLVSGICPTVGTEFDSEFDVHKVS